MRLIITIKISKRQLPDKPGIVCTLASRWPNPRDVGKDLLNQSCSIKDHVCYPRCLPNWDDPPTAKARPASPRAWCRCCVGRPSLPSRVSWAVLLHEGLRTALLVSLLFGRREGFRSSSPTRLTVPTAATELGYRGAKRRGVNPTSDHNFDASDQTPSDPVPAQGSSTQSRCLWFST